MWNTDSFGWQESTDPIYKSIPFFLEMHDGRTLGVLFDNTYRTFFDFGRQNPAQYTFSAPAGPLDYYILYGPEPKHVVETYAWLTGPTPLPPLWALGYQQSRYSYTPRSQVEDIAAHLRRDNIPADAIWLDIDYQYKYRPFTVDPTTFPDFPGLIHKLAAEHFHTIVIADLHIADAPNQNYHPYDSGIATDQFVKLHGQTYVGDVWPGPSVFPDFTQASTRTWFGSLYKDFIDDGVAGFWDDMNEPAVFTYPSKTMPLDVVHRINGEEAEGFAPRTALHSEIHNVYGMENSRATMEGELTLRPNLRPYVMTRATYAGGQRYAVTWTGDNLSTWNHLRMTTPQLLNLGLSGFSLAGADVGGFGGSPSPDLLTKWLMLAAFQPIDRDHAAKGTRPHEPWVDGPAARSHPPPLHRPALSPHALPLHRRRGNLPHRHPHHPPALPRVPPRHRRQPSPRQRRPRRILLRPLHPRRRISPPRRRRPLRSPPSPRRLVRLLDRRTSSTAAKPSPPTTSKSATPPPLPSPRSRPSWSTPPWAISPSTSTPAPSSPCSRSCNPPTRNPTAP